VSSRPLHIPQDPTGIAGATVFIFTGTDNPEAERQAHKLRVTEFLKKGFALPSLVEIEARAQESPKPVPAPSAGSSWWKLKM
jgi:hypothetical protein